jgi:hypothetical protein
LILVSIFNRVYDLVLVLGLAFLVGGFIEEQGIEPKVREPYL